MGGKKPPPKKSLGRMITQFFPRKNHLLSFRNAMATSPEAPPSTPAASSTSRGPAPHWTRMPSFPGDGMTGMMTGMMGGATLIPQKSSIHVGAYTMTVTCGSYGIFIQFPKMMLKSL